MIWERKEFHFVEMKERNIIIHLERENNRKKKGKKTNISGIKRENMIGISGNNNKKKKRQ